MAQVVATTFSCFIQVAVLNFALTNIKDVCTPHQPEHFTCPGGKVFFSGKQSASSSMRLSSQTDLYSFRHLGSYWPSKNLLTRSSLLRPLLVLPRRRSNPSNLLLCSTKMAQIPHQVLDGTAALWRSRFDSPCNTTQLPLMGYRRFRVPEVHQDKVLRMVVETKLPDQLWIRSWTGTKHAIHLLRLHIRQRASAELVGKYHRERYNGCAGYGRASNRCSWRTFWPRCVVMEECLPVYDEKYFFWLRYYIIVDLFGGYFLTLL
jgi:hypothetical protein